ncbi:unnamed protein product [Camellia sinensis]
MIRNFRREQIHSNTPNNCHEIQPTVFQNKCQTSGIQLHGIALPHVLQTTHEPKPNTLGAREIAFLFLTRNDCQPHNHNAGEKQVVLSVAMTPTNRTSFAQKTSLNALTETIATVNVPSPRTRCQHHKTVPEITSKILARLHQDRTFTRTSLSTFSL